MPYGAQACCCSNYTPVASSVQAHHTHHTCTSYDNTALHRFSSKLAHRRCKSLMAKLFIVVHVIFALSNQTDLQKKKNYVYLFHLKSIQKKKKICCITTFLPLWKKAAATIFSPWKVVVPRHVHSFKRWSLLAQICTFPDASAISNFEPGMSQSIAVIRALFEVILEKIGAQFNKI